MNSDEPYAELEAVRREITTLTHRLEVSDNHDWNAAAQARLGTFEDAERDLLQQLAEARGGWSLTWWTTWARGCLARDFRGETLPTLREKNCPARETRGVR